MPLLSNGRADRGQKLLQMQRCDNLRYDAQVCLHI